MSSSTKSPQQVPPIARTQLRQEEAVKFGDRSPQINEFIQQTNLKVAPGQNLGESLLASRKKNSLPAPEIEKQSPGPVVQTKLSIGQPGDINEQEADAIAQKVMEKPSMPRQQQSHASPLSPGLQAKMEGALGADFSNVNVHTGSSEAENMGALAFTQGNDLHFAPGQYNPGTPFGQQLIGHELSHVVQQREGRVQAAGQQNGAPVNTDPDLEQEADRIGAKAAQFKLSEQASPTPPPANAGRIGPARQMKPEGPTQDQGPQFDEYKGQSIGKSGRVSAPAKHYQHAKSIGVNIRNRPDGSLSPTGSLLYNQEIRVEAADTTGQFYFVIPTKGGPSGWINHNFVALDAPDPRADLHHITEPDLTTILKKHYVDTGKWALSTGNDYTTLAAAVQFANRDRAGISMDPVKMMEYIATHNLKTTFDPWMAQNFAQYTGSVVLSGHNIWLPPADYIRMLQDSGVIGSRPKWLNTAVEIGRGIGGFVTGVFDGVFGSIWEMLSGLWEVGQGIASMVRGVFDGTLFNAIGAIYESVMEFLSLPADEMWCRLSALVEEVVTMGRNALGDFAKMWNHPDQFQAWHFRGKVIGTIAMEVVLAIFTGGYSLAAKVVAKVGKYFPKLAKVLNRILAKADDLDPRGRKKKGDGPGGASKGDPNPDNKDFPEDIADEDRDWYQTLTMARIFTEAHDAKDTPVSVLIPLLNGTFAAKSDAVKRYEATSNGDQSYKIIQLKKRDDTVDPVFTPRNERRNVNDHEGPDLGHTVERHVGKSDNWLRNRLESDPNTRVASTFTNEAAANRALGLFVKRHKAEIAKWLKENTEEGLTMSFDTGSIVGNVLEKGKSKSQPASKVRVVIRRNSNSPQGWYFHTSYPEL